jgi:hypothetical protein
MKNISRSILGLLTLSGLCLGPMIGCAGGYVEASEPVYYGGDPWVQTDVVIGGGGGWYGGHRDNAYVHPDARRGGRPEQRHASAPARRDSSHANKSDDHRK